MGEVRDMREQSKHRRANKLAEERLINREVERRKSEKECEGED